MNLRPSRFFFFLCAPLFVAACGAPPLKASDLWTGSDHCRNHCNAEHARCFEQTGAQREQSGMPSGLGPAGACSSSLRECFAGCGGR